MFEIPPDIYDKISAWCSYRERSEKEVREKLRKMTISGDPAARAIERLREEGFLSNERFARSYAEGKFRIKKWGRKQILYQLRQKGIPDDLAEQALSFIPEENYSETIRALAEKKWNSLKDPAPQRKQKVLRYLAGKGFEFSLCLRAIESLEA